MTPAPSWTTRVRRVFRRHPVMSMWTIATLINVALIPVFLLTGSGEAIDRGLAVTGLDFNTDLVTAARLIVGAPFATVGVLLALAQVASPDLAFLLVATVGLGPAAVSAVRRRWRFWAPEVGARRGMLVWLSMIGLFSAMNLASAGLHRLTVPADFTWSPPTFGPAFLTAFAIALFLDAGALFEESGWRGFALPLLQARMTPVAASVVLGVLWSLWHVPVKFDLALDYGAGRFVGLFAVLTVKFVLLTVIMTFFCNRVGGSVPIAVAMHGLSNDSVRLGGLVDSDVWVVQLVTEVNLALPMALVAGLLLWRSRGRLGLGPGVDAGSAGRLPSPA